MWCFSWWWFRSSSRSLTECSAALERIRASADDLLAGGVALIGEVDRAPALLATTDQTIAEVADGAVRTQARSESSWTEGEDSQWKLLRGSPS